MKSTKNLRAKKSRLKKVELALDRNTLALAERLGTGNLALGIRRAVAIAACRAARMAENANV